MEAIRMLEDRDGAPDHITIYTYQAGEIYSETTTPRATQEQMAGFVASGHAIEVDADGNPVAKPGDARATKVTGPKATKATQVTDDSPAPEADTAPVTPDTTPAPTTPTA